MKNHIIDNDDKIAIVGMVGRFPDAPGLDAFWENILLGKESIHRFDYSEFEWCHKWKHASRAPNFIAAKGDLSQADCFDAEFFKISPNKAKLLDPQFRQLLELTWQAWEDAGYSIKDYKGKVGVYATSSSLDSYWHENILKNNAYASMDFNDEVHISNAKDFLATLIAYHFNFKGPALNIQTACSSALVAMDHACNDLFERRCDAAVVAAACVTFPLKNGYLYKEGMIYSKDGHCRAFADDASGIVPGNGAGVVILKKLSQAVIDGDHIYATIIGHAVNNDGYDKLSFSAPSTLGQYEVLVKAAKNADINPKTVGYIEAHGSATVLGDQIEMRALKQYRDTHPEHAYPCYIGSVKSNIGHLDVAAGMAGFIKSALAIYHKKIPKTLHADNPNPNLKIQNSGLKIANASLDWHCPETFPRRAGVSSFGIGGTNAHVILEEYCSKENEDAIEVDRSCDWHILPISAKTEDALSRLKDDLAIKINQNSYFKLQDISFTLQNGRNAFDQRLAVVCSTREEAYNALFLPETFDFMHYGKLKSKNKNVYLFSGHFDCSQNYIYVQYHDNEFIYRHVSACLDIINDVLKMDLVCYFNGSSKAVKHVNNKLEEVLLSFVINYAYAQYWFALGIHPDTVVGFGIGEITAACFAGVFSVKDAVRLIHTLMSIHQDMPCYVCYSVLASPLEVNRVLNNKAIFRVVANNAPKNCYIKVLHADIDCVKSNLDENKILYQEVQHMAIDALPDKQAETWRLFLNTIDFHSPSINIKTTRDDELLVTVDQAEYWLTPCYDKNYYHSMRELLHEQHNTFIEMGLTYQLNKWVQQINHYEVQSQIQVFSSLPSESGVSIQKIFAINIAKIWASGQTINWALWRESLRFNGKHKRVPLSVYPFEKKQYCIMPQIFEQKDDMSEKVSEGMRYNLMSSQWFELSDYEKIDLQILAIIYVSDQPKKAEALIKAGIKHHPNMLVSKLCAMNKNDLHSEEAIQKRKISWVKQLSGLSMNVVDICIIQSDGYAIFYDLQALARALVAMHDQVKIRLTVIVEGMAQIDSYDPINLAASLVLGPLACLPLEHHTVQAKCIDISYQDFALYTDLMINEILMQQDTDLIAFRGGRRFGRCLTKLKPYLAPKIYSEASLRLKQYGVYVITGGCGGVGLTLAEYLAKKYMANIILISRTKLPPKSHWVTTIANQGSSLNLVRQLQRLQQIEACANQILIYHADISHFEAISSIIDQVRSRFGMINGVIHAASPTPEKLLQNKSFAQAQEMFLTKIEGMKVLQKCFSQDKLDFMLLFSGLNVFSPTPGMADYISANAYFHAFAHDIEKHAFPVITVAWDAWTEIGMRVNYHERSLAKTSSAYALGYGKWIPLIKEHIVQNQMLLVGAMYIEASIATIIHHTKSISSVRLNDLSFLEPGIISDLAYDVLLVDNSSHDVIDVYLHGKANQSKLFRCHYSINDSNVSHDDKHTIDADAVLKRFEQMPFLENEALLKLNKENKDSSQAHWQCLEWVKKDKLNYLAKIEMCESLSAEVKQFYLHPSILDVAYSFNVQFLDGIYLPYYIEKYIFYTVLPASFYSFMEITQLDASAGICVSNITLFAEDGRLLSVIQGLVLRKLMHHLDHKAADRDQSGRIHGLSSAEALSAFEQVFNMPNPEVIIVKQKEAEKIPDSPVTTKLDKVGETGVTAMKNSPVVQVAESLSDGIATIWKNMFGFDTVSMQDDFFDYGDSFMAIDLCHQINTAYEIHLSPYVLFQHPVLEDFIKACSQLEK